MKKNYKIRKYSPLWVAQKTVEAILIITTMVIIASADSITESITNMILH